MLDSKEALRIEKRKSKSGSTYKVYYFTCSSCNKEICAQQSQLKRHSGKCRSCTQKGEPYFFIYTELKNHKNKKVDFDLSFEEFKELISNPFCHYCNKKLTYNEFSKNWGKNLSRSYQLDRKDNNLGYNKNNLVTCCWNCNRLKSDYYTYEEFMELSPILKEINKNRENGF